MPRKWNHEDFERNVSLKAGEEYRPLGTYKNYRTKVLMLHVTCGNEWEITPANFIHYGMRCPACATKKNADILRVTHEDFVKRVKLESDDEYTVIGKYVNSLTKILIKHDECEYNWEVIPSNFTRGIRCPNCAGNRRISHEEYLSKVFSATKGEYEVLGHYEGYDTPILMQHISCGYKWESKAGNFIRNSRHSRRCPKCIESKGELVVSKFLDNLGILYERQYKTEECKNEKCLAFDFAVIENDKVVCFIEYQGIQHYEAVDFFGGDKGFEIRVKRDDIKRAYCKEAGIKLIEIPYTIKDIEKYLARKIEKIINNQLSIL